MANSEIIGAGQDTARRAPKKTTMNWTNKNSYGITCPVVFSSETEEWATPQDFFDEVNKEFGPFELDVCSTIVNAKCNNFYTKAEDSLSQVWSGKCWMNPPYGRTIGVWVKKAYESSLCGATVVCLVPSRTDVAWWHEYAMLADEIRFIRGRLKFTKCSGEILGNCPESVKDGRHAPTSAAPFPTALLIFKAKESPVLGEESPAQNTKEICHTAPNSANMQNAQLALEF
jgi:phage N-6-adenine-methyltransferase